MKKLICFLALFCTSLSGCGWISFARNKTQDELVLESAIRSYYDEVKTVFAVGNPDALAALFTPSISKPMTQPQIRDWAQKFFSAHHGVTMHIDAMDIEQVGWQKALVDIKYRVTTSDGAGAFVGEETDSLVHQNGRWFIDSWVKVH